MGETRHFAHIEVVLDAHEPIELGDFVRAFTSVGNQYGKYLKRSHPDLEDDAQVFVSEVRQGSIIANLVPSLASLIAVLDQALILEQFVRLYGSRIQQYFTPGGRDAESAKSDLHDFMGQVAAIARSKNGSGSLKAVVFEDGKREVKAAIQFNSHEAKIDEEELSNHILEIENLDSAEYNRVVMTFKRTDKGDVELGKRSGERVFIEKISERDLPLIYASAVAEQRIKHEILDAQGNAYFKAFVVDVNLETRRGKPIAYRVTNVHQVFEISPDVQ